MRGMAEVFSQRMGEAARYGFDWSAFLAGATITASDWTAPAGLTLAEEANDPTSTSVLATAAAAGRYRLTNQITTTDGQTPSQDYLIVVEEVPSGAYLGADEAELRLAAYGVEDADISQGDVLAASLALDAGWGPFVGARRDAGQVRAFPRSTTPEGVATSDATVPPEVLDAVSLMAYELATDEGPAVTSESVLDRSVTYSTPKPSRTTTMIQALLEPYRVRSVSLSSGRRSRQRRHLYP